MMTVKFKCELAYRVRCSRCDATHTPEYWPLDAGCEVPNPSLPDSWRVLDGLPICDRHEVEVRDLRESLTITVPPYDDIEEINRMLAASNGRTFSIGITQR